MEDLFRADEPEKPAPAYGTAEFRQAYDDYIRTPAWKKLGREVKARAKGRCENAPLGAYHPGPFSTHHLTYERFRHERLTDLKYPCPGCHDMADEKRKRDTAAKNAAAYEEAGERGRLEAHKASYFRTTYGPDWAELYYHDPETLDQDYSDWVESKGDPRDN